MEIIDRYVYEVTKELPQTQKADIEKELRGLIEDMLAERCGESTPGAGDVEAVLKKLGNPGKLAESYSDKKKYLIGPDLYSLYLKIVRIVVSVAMAGVAVGKIIELFVNPPLDMVEGVAGIFGAILSAGFEGFAWVTIIFAIVERVSTGKGKLLKDKEWKVEDLKAVPIKGQAIRLGDTIVGIIFCILFIVLFNFNSQLFGIYIFENGKHVNLIPVFSPEGIKPFLPVITALFSLSILKDCVKLIAGKWSLWLGVFSAALNIVCLGIFIFIFSNPAIWNADFTTWLNVNGFVHVTAEGISADWLATSRCFIAVVSLILGIDAVVSIIKGIRYCR